MTNTKDQDSSDISSSNIDYSYSKLMNTSISSESSSDNNDSIVRTAKRPQPKTVGIVTEYAHTELFPHDLLTYDDVAAIYVIDTEFLRDSFNAGLANLHLDTIIGKDSTIYYTYTNYIFCAIVEISLCTIANSGNDVQYVTEMVLEEQYDNGVSIRETVSTSDDIDGTSVISQLVTPIYGGLVKYLISFSSEIKHSNLVPIHWSYPNYQYLSIGELYDY